MCYDIYMGSYINCIVDNESRCAGFTYGTNIPIIKCINTLFMKKKEKIVIIVFDDNAYVDLMKEMCNLVESGIQLVLLNAFTLHEEVIN